MRWVIAFLGFLLWGSQVSAQTQEFRLQGSVTDSLSKPIPLVQVIVRSQAGGQILSFISANAQGQYQLIFSTNRRTIHLEARRIGYETYQATLDLSLPIGEPYNIVLLEKSTSLDEVVIEGNRPIKQNGDTLTYQVEAFTDGTEKVAEDVLKKIPGVEVSDDGAIQYQGKEIKKILLDGDDLTDSKYKILSKNLSAELLSEVEILKNYTDNRLFKGIEQTDDVAINLKIKEGRKAPLFGDVEAGGGFENVYSANTNVLSYMKGFKGLLTGDVNNIGADAIGSDIQRFNTGNLEYRQFQFSQALIRTRLGRPGFISDKYLRFHDSKYGTLNFILRPTDKMSIRAMTSLYGNTIDYETRQSISYHTLPTPVNISQAQKQTIRPREVFSDLKINYQLGKNSDLDIRTHFTQNDKSQDTRNILNYELIPDSLSNDSYVALIEAQVTNRINPNLAVKTQLSFLEDALNQNYGLTNANLDSGGELLQTINQDSRNVGLTSSVKANWKGLSINGVLGWVEINRNLSSDLSNENELDVFTNDLRYRNNSLFAEVLVKREQRRFEFTVGGRFRNEDFELRSDRANRTFFEPTLGISSKFARFYKTGIVYTKQYGLNQLPYLYSNPIVTNYRTLTSNAVDFRQALTNESVVFYLNFNDPEKSFVTAFVRALYVRSSPVVSISNVIENSGSLINQRSLFGQSETYSFTSGFDKYFPHLSSTFKISYLADLMEIPNIVNDEELNTRISNQGIKMSMGSAFEGFFNFGVSASMNRTSSVTDLGNSAFYFGRFNEKVTLRPNNRFYTVLEAEQLVFFSEDGNTSSLTPLGSVRMDYTIKPNKASIELRVQNIFNQETAEIQSVDQISVSQSTYYLFPRYFLISLKYRF